MQLVQLQSMSGKLLFALPVDYAFTEPQIVISSQPTIQSVSSGVLTAADQLTVSLPPLGDAWSVAVWPRS